MTQGACSQHPLKPALYRCDGCGDLLCRECIDEGHRLLFCRHCGERAFPLEGERPATTPELRTYRTMHASYELSDALAYPFRGHGAHLLWAYVIVLAAPPLLGQLLPIIGCFGLLFMGAVLFLMPGLYFAIVRDTAEGGTELPDWPDFTEYWERIQEVAFFLAAGLFLIVPLFFAFRWAGCDLEALSGGAGALGCAAAGVAGALVGTWLWMPSVAATGTYSSFWLTFRVDLHLRALVSSGQEGWATGAMVFGLIAAGQVIKAALGWLPYVGDALSLLVGGYALFTSAHLIGLWVRHHRETMDRIYLG